jgi:hypothetical protein
MGIPAILSDVPATTPYIQYVATSLQTVFPYPFPITQDSDLVVVVNGVTLATDSGYTLSGQGNDTGGNLTFAVGQTAGVIVTLYRDIPIERLTQIAQNSGFSSTVFNAEFNNIYLIMQQIQAQFAQVLQVPNTNNPVPTVLLTPAQYANKYLSFDANGNPTPATLTSSGSVTQALILGLINGITTFETAAGLVSANINVNYWPGDLRRYGGVADSGATNNTTPLQNALNACAGFIPVVIDAAGTGYFGGLTTVVTVPAGTDLQFKNGASLRWASTTASSGPTIGGAATRPGLSITGNGVKISGLGSIVGPTASNTFVGNEYGIICVGASAAAPITGIEIVGVEITGWGQGGIELKWCSQLKVNGNYIHDCGYSGVRFLTCNNVQANGNEVGPIKPGSTNAYGISFTYDGTASPTSSRSDANHFCIGVECAFNFIHDIPLWEGIDAHGLFDGNVHHNKVYNCWTGIQVASAASGAVGENNSISFNEINILQYNGSATTVVASNPMGITINGFSTTIMHAGVRVVGNVISGYGNNASPPTAFSIQATYTDGAVIADNIIRNWQGFGIYSAAGNGGVISGNVFGALAGIYANDACIHIEGGNSGSPWHIGGGNMHHIASGTAAHFGASNNTGSADDMVIGVNDFTSAQTAQYGGASGSALTAIHFVPWHQPILSSNTGTTGGVGYGTGAGGTVTQSSSRTTGVTLNTPSGQITLVSGVGSVTPASFTVTNSAVAATDTVNVCQSAGTDLYEIFVTHIAAGSFKITFFTTGGTSTEQPVFNFTVTKGAAA